MFATIKFDTGDVYGIEIDDDTPHGAWEHIDRLIEKDTPLKPSEKWRYRGYGEMIGACIRCGATVSMRFCPACGQRVDWSE